MNRMLNFYIASGSSQTLTEFPGVRELIKSLQAGKSRGTQPGGETRGCSGSRPVPTVCFWKSGSWPGCLGEYLP